MTVKEYLKASIEEKKEYNKKLVEEYPFVKPYNVWSGKPIEDYDYEDTWMDDMPDGWRIAFQDQFLKELKEELIRFGYLDKYTILQIKEKYGMARIYSGGSPKGIVEDTGETEVYGDNKYPKDTKEYKYERDFQDPRNNIDSGDKVYKKFRYVDRCKVSDIENKYELLSSCICIDCGKRAKWLTRGYILPFCDECKPDENCDRIEDVYSEHEIQRMDKLYDEYTRSVE